MQMHRDHLKTFSLLAVVLLTLSVVVIIDIGTEDSDAISYGSESSPLSGLSADAYEIASGKTFYIELGGTVNVVFDNWGPDTGVYNCNTVTSGYGLSVQDSGMLVAGILSKVGTITVSYIVDYSSYVENCYFEIEVVSLSTPVTSISISGTSTVKVGSSVTLSATTSPTGATDRGVFWSIYSGSSYVSISGSSNSSGGTCTVTGLKAGTATIRATATDGSGVTKDYSVIVEAVEYTFDLYYSANGGSGAPGTQSYTSTENTSHTFSISTTKPTWDGYLFLGWSTSSSASSASYQAGGTISVEPNDYERLYAVWQRIYTYVFEFDANGGTGGPSTQTYSGKTSSTFSIDVPADTPTKSGSTFLGWSESSTATSPTYTVGGNQIPITATGSTTTKFLYAVWSQEQITVSGTPSDLNTKAGSSWSYTPDLSVSGATITVSGASWLSVVNGTVVGTPTASGTYNVTLTFEKSGYASGTQTFTINVVPALVFDSAPTGGVIAYAV